jgi:hypothetical protein
MRLSVRMVFAVLMLVTAAWSQAPAQPAAQAPAQIPAAPVQAPAQTAAPTPAQIPSPNPFDTFQQFSASVSGGPLKWDKMKIYRSGNLIRADWDHQHEIRISNLAKRGGFYIRDRIVMHKPKMCEDTDMMDIGSYPFFAYTSSDFNVEKVNVPAEQGAEKETIDGHSCKVENYAVKKKDGTKLVAKVTMWRAEDLNGFPIRMDIDPPATKKLTLYYTNVSLERPDPELFRRPAFCHAVVPPKKKQPTSTPKAPTQASPKPPQ